MAFNAEEHQHMRYNPLKGEWVLVSPHRTLRPWSGQRESLQEDKILSHDPNNPLCPGVQRSSGLVTPNYKGTFVFPNDYPALLETVPSPPRNDDPLFQMSAATGVCRVMCFHENSDVILPTLPLEHIVRIVDRWIQETEELGKSYAWVQIFENKGAVMGCSNPHPHCQIWASNFLPNEARIKNLQQKEFFDNFKKPLLIDYMEKEIVKQERLVCENEHWIVVVPFWAVWPYETMVLPKRHIKRFTDVSEEEKITLSDIIQQITTKYDNLFKCNFPYSMGWHGAPTGAFNSLNVDHWTFHGVYYPPLLRSAKNFALVTNCVIVRHFLTNILLKYSTLSKHCLNQTNDTSEIDFTVEPSTHTLFSAFNSMHRSYRFPGYCYFCEIFLQFRNKFLAL